MKRSMNPSSIKSRNYIMESFIDLMQIKKFDEISISEITENADVVRRTFYRHFTSKQDVLDACFETIYYEALQSIDELGDSFDCLMSAHVILKICERHQDFFLALKHNNMLMYLMNRWTNALPDLHNYFLDRITQFPETNTKEELEYLLTFNAGGVFNIIIKWINDGMRLTIDELSQILDQLAIHSLILPNNP